MSLPRYDEIASGSAAASRGSSSSGSLEPAFTCTARAEGLVWTSQNGHPGQTNLVLRSGHTLRRATTVADTPDAYSQGTSVAFLGETHQDASDAAVSVRVPTWPAYAALLSSLLAAGLLVQASGRPVIAGLGYVFGAVITPVFAVAHRILYESTRKNPWFVHSEIPGRIVIVALTIGLVAGMGHAWFLATELAKQ